LKTPARLLACAAVAALFAACSHDPDATAASAGARQGSAPRTVASATDIDRALREAARGTPAGQELWPGFDALSVPLAIFDGTRTWLFRHPKAPAGFQRVDGGEGSLAFEGRHPAMVANSVVELEGTPTATLVLPRELRAKPLAQLAGLAMHEVFHVYQRRHQPAWSGNEVGLFTYPVNDASSLAQRIQESRALRAALEERNAERMACAARAALDVRQLRFAAADPAHVRYERATELNEGLATYIESRVAGQAVTALKPDDLPPQDIRQRTYASGLSLALLLDRLSPTWKSRLSSESGQHLDGLLGAALGEGPRCAPPSPQPDALELARERVVQALAQRRQQLAAFEAQAGTRVVVEVAAGELLWPEGFDPLNVTPLDAQRLLHRRFLRLGNGSTRIEILELAALTEGNGTHPLFNGVRQLNVVTRTPPKLLEAQGELTLDGPGLALRARGASWKRAGDELRIRVGESP
jgi:hypothetical protein